MKDTDLAILLDTALAHLTAAKAALATGDRTKADACADAAHDVIDYVCATRAAEAAGLRDLTAADPETFVVVNRAPSAPASPATH